MSRQIAFFRDGKWCWYDKTDLKVAAAAKPRLYIQTDSMNATWHPGNGQTYDSKSEFRRVTAALGYQELGNDQPTVTPPKYDSEDLRADIAEVLSGHGI